MFSRIGQLIGLKSALRRRRRFQRPLAESQNCTPAIESLESRTLLAATMVYSIEADVDTGQWLAYGEVQQPGQTAGIAAFRFNVIADGGLTVLDSTVIEIASFGLFPSGGSFGVDIHASQNTFSPASVVEGVGLNGPVLLASGRFSGDSGSLSVVDLFSGSSPGTTFLSGPVVAGQIVATQFADAVVNGSIDIVPEVNLAPLVVGDSYRMAAGQTLTVDATGVLENDHDPNGDSLTAQLVRVPTAGVVTLQSNGSFTYTPEASFSGFDSFEYVARDDTGLVSEPVTVDINVSGNALPFGAAADDTAEFMLGEVLVTVVLMESDGSIDANREDWTSTRIAAVKSTIETGLEWWEEALALENSAQSLDFVFDYTYADQPVSTGYEPIARQSNDFVLWMDDFLDEVGFNTGANFSDNIRAFNHSQRVAQGTDWAFTIFVANSFSDDDGKFAPGGNFRQAFAFAGGRMVIMPATRPASAVAHEVGHIFYAYDEATGSASYNLRRGYYNTQNTNAYDDNPEPATRVASIMASHAGPFLNHQISQSAKAILGWQDTDGDGIFDVLDVPHSLVGSGIFDSQTGTYRFTGQSSVGTLPNQNTSGLGNAITLNEISRLEYRIDDGAWISAAQYGTASAQIDVVIDSLPTGRRDIEFRTIDVSNGVTSPTFADSYEINATPWQNRPNRFDVDSNGVVNALDLLLVIRDINDYGNRLLPAPSETTPPPFVDVNGDGIVNPLDIIQVIRELNRIVEGTAEGEPVLATETLRDGITSDNTVHFGGGSESTAFDWIGAARPANSLHGITSTRRVIRSADLVEPIVANSPNSRQIGFVLTAEDAKPFDLELLNESTLNESTAPVAEKVSTNFVGHDLLFARLSATID